MILKSYNPRRRFIYEHYCTNPDLVQLMRIHCKTIWFTFDENENEYFLSICYLFRNSRVERIDSPVSVVRMIGYGFPIMDREIVDSWEEK